MVEAVLGANWVDLLEGMVEVPVETNNYFTQNSLFCISIKHFSLGYNLQ